MAKEEKTAEELKAILGGRIAQFQLGEDVNPRWIKIVPADPAKEGANWKVSHSSRTVSRGKLEHAINKITPDLQKLYDLKEQ